MINIAVTGGASSVAEYVFPGGYAIPDGAAVEQLMFGSGYIEYIRASDGVVSIHNAIDAATGLPIGDADEGMRYSFDFGDTISSGMHPVGQTATAFDVAFDETNRILQFGAAAGGAVEHEGPIYAPTGFAIGWTGTDIENDVLSIVYHPISLGSHRYKSYLRGVLHTYDDASQSIATITEGTPTIITVASAVSYPRNKRFAADIAGCTGGSPNLDDGRYTCWVTDSTGLEIAIDTTTGATVTVTSGTILVRSNSVYGQAGPVSS